MIGRRIDLYEEEKRAMIMIIRKAGIHDEQVLSAMSTVPRHLFVDKDKRSFAYENTSLGISCEQTISQPYTVAYMTQELKIHRGDTVLEIGTGSGYQAAILSSMGAKVFTIERHFQLLETARKRFEELRLNIASRAGDGTIGWKEYAPYDKIIVTAGSPDIPPALVGQLGENGILVIPVGSKAVQKMMVIVKKNGRVYSEEKDTFKFVPLIGKEAWHE
jgi:protein-L-isoaspartate(D-aspartate) O-methyltransferase